MNNRHVFPQLGLPGLEFANYSSAFIDIRQNWVLCPPSTPPISLISVGYLEVSAWNEWRRHKTFFANNFYNISKLGIHLQENSLDCDYNANGCNYNDATCNKASELL